MEKATIKSKNTSHYKLNVHAKRWRLRRTAADISELQTRNIVAGESDDWKNDGLSIIYLTLNGGRMSDPPDEE